VVRARWSCLTLLATAALVFVACGDGAAVVKSAARAVVTSDLASPAKKEIAMELVSSAENSSLNWRLQYPYIQDIHDGRGYTGGLIGFTSGTGDMLQVVEAYTRVRPRNALAKFVPALRRVDGTASHGGLGPPFVAAWRRAAKDPRFRQAQDSERDRNYFNPSVALAKSDGLNALGQFAYYDAAVVHGYDALRAIRARALKKAQPPAAGGDEVAYLEKFLDERVVQMHKSPDNADVSRIEGAQRRFLHEGNLDLHLPLRWSVYGDKYAITR
jgi:chitosanase